MSAAYRPADGVRFVLGRQDDGSSHPTGYVAVMPAGPILVLEAVAGLIWTEATTGDASDWVARVAAASAMDEQDVADDVRLFAAGLAEQGLLVACV